jgi:hypothetical protein
MQRHCGNSPKQERAAAFDAHLRGVAVFLLLKAPTHSESRWGRERGRSIPFATYCSATQSRSLSERSGHRPRWVARPDLTSREVRAGAQQRAKGKCCLLTQNRAWTRFSVCCIQPCQANENALATNPESPGQLFAVRPLLLCCRSSSRIVAPRLRDVSLSTELFVVCVDP